MIKLESKSKSDNKVFYFNDINECNEFKNSLKNNGAHIKWKKPEYVEDDESLLNDSSTREIVEDNLSWGLSSPDSLERTMEFLENGYVDTLFKEMFEI